MAGLLSPQSPQVGGLLGGPPPKAGFLDYALAALASGGLSGAAALALKQRAGQQQYARQAPIMNELASAFAQPSAAPQMQGAGMDGAPVSQGQPTQQGPSYATLAPLLARAQANGVDTSPFEGLLGNMSKAEKENRPSFYNTGDNLVSVDPRTGQPKVIYTDPAKAPTAPMGYRFKPDGVSLEYVPGGPADPNTIQTGAETRRNVLVKNPLPSRARAAGRSAASSGLPPGYVPR